MSKTFKVKSKFNLGDRVWLEGRKRPGVIQRVEWTWMHGDGPLRASYTILFDPVPATKRKPFPRYTHGYGNDDTVRLADWDQNGN